MLTVEERAREFAKIVCECDGCGGECMRHCDKFVDIKNAYIVGFERSFQLATDWLGDCLPNIEYITNASALRQDKVKFIESFRKHLKGE